jgi:hypothetical protein
MYFEYDHIIKDELIAYNFEQLIDLIINPKLKKENSKNIISTLSKVNSNEKLVLFIKNKLNLNV